MEYNFFSKDNEGVLSSILDSASSNLVFASDNAFATSALLEELSPGAKDGSYKLFNGSACINPEVESVFCIVVTSLGRVMNHEISMLNCTYKVVIFTRAEENSFKFNITIQDYSEFEHFKVATTMDEVTQAINSFNERSLDICSTVLGSLKSHNVIFLQNVDDNIVKILEDNNEATYSVHKFEELSGDSVILTKDANLVVILCDSPDENCVGYYDSLGAITYLLKSGVIIVCNTTWVRVFIDLATVESTINLNTTVIYNSPDFGEMGNKELYV